MFAISADQALVHWQAPTNRSAPNPAASLRELSRRNSTFPTTETLLVPSPLLDSNLRSAVFAKRLYLRYTLQRIFLTSTLYGAVSFAWFTHKNVLAYLALLRSYFQPLNKQKFPGATSRAIVRTVRPCGYYLKHFSTLPALDGDSFVSLVFAALRSSHKVIVTTIDCNVNRRIYYVS